MIEPWKSDTKYLNRQAQQMYLLQVIWQLTGMDMRMTWWCSLRMRIVSVIIVSYPPLSPPGINRPPPVWPPPPVYWDFLVPPGIDFYIGKICMIACFFAYASPSTIYKYYQLYGIFIKVFNYKGIISQWFLTEKLYEDTFCKKNYVKRAPQAKNFSKLADKVSKF